MIIIRNNLIPFKGFAAMTVWPFLFVRKDCELDAASLNHEAIHARQQREMLIVLFYVWYVVEYLVRLVQYRCDAAKAYRNISLEREAYTFQNVSNYLDVRTPYAWIYEL